MDDAQTANNLNLCFNVFNVIIHLIVYNVQVSSSECCPCTFYLGYVSGSSFINISGVQHGWLLPTTSHLVRVRYLHSDSKSRNDNNNNNKPTNNNFKDKDPQEQSTTSHVTTNIDIGQTRFTSAATSNKALHSLVESMDTTIKRAREQINPGDLLSVWGIVALISIIVVAPMAIRHMQRSDTNYDDLDPEDPIADLANFVRAEYRKGGIGLANGDGEQGANSAMGGLVADLLRSPQIQNAVNDLINSIITSPQFKKSCSILLKELWADLVEDPETLKQVIHLLYNAIQDEAIKDAAVQLVTEVFSDKEVLDELVELTQRLGQERKVQQATQGLLVESAHNALNDPEILDHSMEFATDVVGDDVVQQTAGEALYNTLSYAVRPTLSVFLTVLGTGLLVLSVVAFRHASSPENQTFDVALSSLEKLDLVQGLTKLLFLPWDALVAFSNTCAWFMMLPFRAISGFLQGMGWAGNVTVDGINQLISWVLNFPILFAQTALGVVGNGLSMTLQALANQFRAVGEALSGTIFGTMFLGLADGFGSLVSGLDSSWNWTNEAVASGAYAVEAIAKRLVHIYQHVGSYVTAALGLCLINGKCSNAEGSSAAANEQIIKPHILMIVMDDLGSQDLGIHGSGIHTPHANKLALQGVYLDNYYVLPYCSPTRAALLSAKYPLHTGVHNVIWPPSTAGLPLQEETLADLLHRAGYHTTAIGKWHIGHSNWNQTPTFRGFDEFFGFYYGGEDYYTHMHNGGYDLRHDQQRHCGKGCSRVAAEAVGNYSSPLFAKETIRMLHDYLEKQSARDAKSVKPLFQYLAFQAVHCPNEVPEEYVDMYDNFTTFSPQRKIYAGMLTAADDAIGEVIDAYKKAGIWNDTLVIFTTDNGGPTTVGCIQGSSNYPKRGGKCTLWEDGTTGDGFIGGPALQNLGVSGRRRFRHLFHVVDWLPTIAEWVGVVPRNLDQLDGMSQVDSLRYGGATRTELFVGFSDNENGGHQSWFGPSLRHLNWKIIQGDYGGPDEENPKAIGIKHPMPGGSANSSYLLFDLEMDPMETLNLADDYPEILQDMIYKLQLYQQSYVAPQVNDGSDCPFPGFVNYTGVGPTWEPWCTPDDLTPQEYSISQTME
eukprot:Nitzschia sp. Nitz4//scaffold32_size149145//69827//74087//NITZ4_002882-RA/size149145-processed-gene-0.96-mRNA-1//1//CDS//3329548078//5304//frame0